jgi:xanthine/CO dehydrogenase XdhC/CoxF family maturation factor
MTDYLDGNVLGGALGELFAVDVTAAVARCAACGTPGVVAEARVYPGGPGLVARCASCGEIVIRLVRGPDRAWLDLRGVSSLQLAVGEQSPAAGR